MSLTQQITPKNDDGSIAHRYIPIAKAGSAHLRFKEGISFEEGVSFESLLKEKIDKPKILIPEDVS